MMTQPSPRYLIGFGTEIVHYPDTFALLILSTRALFDLFAHVYRLIPAGSRPCRVLDVMDHVPRVVGYSFYFPTWPTNPLLGRL